MSKSKLAFKISENNFNECDTSCNICNINQCFSFLSLSCYSSDFPNNFVKSKYHKHLKKNFLALLFLQNNFPC